MVVIFRLTSLRSACWKPSISRCRRRRLDGRPTSPPPSAPVLIMSSVLVAGAVPGMAFIPPKNAQTLLYIFSVLDITALLGMLVLLVVGACTKRLRSNLVLLNFQLVIFLTAAGQTLMIWTGHASDMAPPVPLCALSGAFIVASPAAKAGAAVGLTGKVRGLLDIQVLSLIRYTRSGRTL
jgi:hypothetical protein